MRARILSSTALCFGLALLPLAGCGRNGEPPAIETHKDAQGNTHIQINNSQIRKDLDRAGQEAQQNARQLGQAIQGGARQIDESDAAITARIKTRLLAAPDLGGLHIEVDTANGNVTLRGRVVSADRKADAEKIASRTKGVKSVDNQIEVGPVS